MQFPEGYLKIMEIPGGGAPHPSGIEIPGGRGCKTENLGGGYGYFLELLI